MGILNLIKKKNNKDSIARFILYYQDSLQFYYDGKYGYKINNNAKTIKRYSLRAKSFYKIFEGHYEYNYMFMAYLTLQKNKLRFFAGKPVVDTDKFKLKKLSVISDTLLIQCFDTLLYDTMKYNFVTNFKVNRETYLLYEFSAETFAEPYFYRDILKVSPLKSDIPRLSKFRISQYKKYKLEVIN